MQKEKNIFSCFIREEKEALRKNLLSLAGYVKMEENDCFWVKWMMVRVNALDGFCRQLTRKQGGGHCRCFGGGLMLLLIVPVVGIFADGFFNETKMREGWIVVFD